MQADPVRNVALLSHDWYFSSASLALFHVCSWQTKLSQYLLNLKPPSVKYREVFSQWASLDEWGHIRHSRYKILVFRIVLGYVFIHFMSRSGFPLPHTSRAVSRLLKRLVFVEPLRDLKLKLRENRCFSKSRRVRENWIFCLQLCYETVDLASNCSISDSNEGDRVEWTVKNPQ